MPRHNPYTVKFEFARGCTQRCPFCSLPEMEWADGPWKFMKPELFRAAIDDLSTWLPKFRMEIAERGEPSFHPKILEFISYARKTIPRVQILLTTNGDRVRKEKEGYHDWVYKVLDAGANLVMLDCYTEDRYKDFRKRFPEASDFFEDNRHPYQYIGPKHKEIILVNATPGMSNAIRWYQNQGGTVNVERARAEGFEIPVVTEPLQKMCVRPFRELVIHWDGTVPICCNDWNEQSILNKFPETGLQEIWELMDVSRISLLEKDRASLKPCDKCSERAGFRVGLEMDWFKT